MAKAKGAHVILLSDSKLIAPNIETDRFIQVATQSTHLFGCYAGAMSVLETLIALLIQHNGKTALDRITAYQSLREEFGEYWRRKTPKVRTTSGN